MVIKFTKSRKMPGHFFKIYYTRRYIWQRMYHEMFASIGKRTWLQSRGGYAGSQAYPTNSYSDGYAACSFTSSPLFVQWGKIDFVCLVAAITGRHNEPVIKFTKSRETPRHFFF